MEAGCVKSSLAQFEDQPQELGMTGQIKLARQKLAVWEWSNWS